MEIDKERLTKEAEKIEKILVRKQNKKGYEFEFQNVDAYDQILMSIGEPSTNAVEKIFTINQLVHINNAMDKGLIEICDFYNQNSNIIQSGLNNYEKILRKDDILAMTPTYELKNITFPMFKELLFEYYSQYGNNIYKIVKKYVNEGRIQLGNTLDPTASGMFFGSNLTKSGYITILKNKKLTLYTLSVLVHELGHAIDSETLHFPQGKNINLLSDIFVEVPSIHFEIGFLDFLIKNNINPNDAHALLDSMYQELSFYSQSFDKLCHLDEFYINDEGYVTNKDDKLIDYDGKEINELDDNDDCCLETQNAMDVTELLKYGLGMYIAMQSNELASQDRKAYIKDLLNFTTQRKESSFIESLERLGITEEQFASSSIIEPRIQKELMYTKKMWNFK